MLTRLQNATQCVKENVTNFIKNETVQKATIAIGTVAAIRFYIQNKPYLSAMDYPLIDDRATCDANYLYNGTTALTVLDMPKCENPSFNIDIVALVKQGAEKAATFLPNISQVAGECISENAVSSVENNAYTSNVLAALGTGAVRVLKNGGYIAMGTAGTFVLALTFIAGE